MARTRGGRSSFTAGESSRQGASRGVVAEELTPGPDDTSVLRLQHDHRSEAIWEGLVSILLSSLACIVHFS